MCACVDLAAANDKIGIPIIIYFYIQHEWHVADDSKHGAYCGNPHALVVHPSANKDISLTTRDFQISEGYVLQFRIAFGCHFDSSDVSSAIPIVLQYSSDYGTTWHLLVDVTDVLRDDNDYTSMVSSTIYYPSTDWRIYTIGLNGAVATR